MARTNRPEPTLGSLQKEIRRLRKRVHDLERRLASLGGLVGAAPDPRPEPGMGSPFKD